MGDDAVHVGRTEASSQGMRARLKKACSQVFQR